MSKIEVNTVEPQCGTTLTLGASGDTVQLGTGASQSGFGRTGTVDWQTTPKTGNFTAANGEGYFVNTTSGAITMTMPSGSAGAIVSIQDYNKTFDTNNLTISPASGEKINGGNADGDLKISTEGQGLTFVYVDSTVGWKTVHENEFTAGGSNFIVATGGTITTSGNCKIHTFTGPGTFCVSTIAVCAANNQVSYMVVAGGGGTGSTTGGYGTGGGGAGGFREDKSPITPYTASPLEGSGPITVTATGFPITVGAGGAGGPEPAPNLGTAGGSSVFSTITSTGGGNSNTSGGSGGGGGGPGAASGTSSGGNGNTPPVSPPQGNTGGPGGHSAGGVGAGGGGGATAVGETATTGPSAFGGDGGAGATTGINGSNTAFAGGGGGGTNKCSAPLQGLGGAGGGGNGQTPNNCGSNGTANTGGGAGGSNGNPAPGKTGGSGVVIIRYKFQ